MSLYREKAVVLRSYKFAEADRIIVLLSENSGKIRAVAKGIRKTTSRVGARLEPLSHVDVQLYRGRDLDTVRQVELIDTHTAMRVNLRQLEQGLSMVEAVDKLTPDREPVPHIYTMLSRALRALNDGSSPIIVGAFYWKLLASEGVAPTLEDCVRCGVSTDLVAIDIQEGGILCRSCRSGTAISQTALDILRQINSGGLAAALALEETPAVREVNHIALGLMEAHLERRLRSIGLFDRHL